MLELVGVQETVLLHVSNGVSKLQIFTLCCIKLPLQVFQSLLVVFLQLSDLPIFRFVELSLGFLIATLQNLDLSSELLYLALLCEETRLKILGFFSSVAEVLCSQIDLGPELSDLFVVFRAGIIILFLSFLEVFLRLVP